MLIYFDNSFFFNTKFKHSNHIIRDKLASNCSAY